MDLTPDMIHEALERQGLCGSWGLSHTNLCIALQSIAESNAELLTEVTRLGERIKNIDAFSKV